VRRAIDSLEAYVHRRIKQLQSIENELRGVAVLNYRQRDLIIHALRHPGRRYTIASHQNSHKVVYQTARTDLLDLARRGLVVQQKKGKTLYFIPARNLEAKLKRLD
jgi:Fic family protein